MENRIRNNEEKREDYASFFNFDVITKIITSYWQWFLLSMIVSLCISYTYLRYTPPVYRVITKMLIKEDEGNKKNNLQNITNLGIISQNYGLENEKQIISSSIIAEKAITDLKLYVNYKEIGKVFHNILYDKKPFYIDIDSDHLKKIDQPVQINVKYSNRLFHISVTYYLPTENHNVKGPYLLKKTSDRLPLKINTQVGMLTIRPNPDTRLNEDINILATIQSPQVVAGNYSNRLSVEPTSEGSSVIKLMVSDKVPQRAVDFLRQLILCYNQQANEDKNEVAARTEQFINDRLAIIHEELGSTDGHLEQYKRRNQLVELKTNAQESSKNETLFKQRLKDANTQIVLLEEIERVIDQQDITTLLPQIGIQDVSSTSLIDEYNKTVMNRNRLLQSASEHSPTVEPLTCRITELSHSIRTSLRQARNKATILRDAIAEQYGQYAHEINNSPRQERVLTQISRQQEVKSGLYLMLLQKREENTISLAATVDKGKMIERPTIAGIIKPRGMIIYPLALLLGLLFPALFFYIRQYLKKNIDNHEDVLSLTHLPIVADIPLAHSKENTSYIVVHENENSLIEESYRYLRTNILFMLNNEEKVILFTSTSCEEGKSFNAVNTAMSFALLGKKIILVGLDIRKPQLEKIFGIDKHTKGITNLLMLKNPTNEQIKDHVIPSSIHDNLHLLLTGTIPPNPAELLARPSLETIFQYLCQEYDYVIVDAAPVGLVTDTLIIGRICDLTIYVIRSHHTMKNSFELINNLESDKKLPHMSLLLNGIELANNKDNQFYGYGQYGKFNSCGYNIDTKTL